MGISNGTGTGTGFGFGGTTSDGASGCGSTPTSWQLAIKRATQANTATFINSFFIRFKIGF
jgi:hypothetical protein